jgi:hypothetical protein
MQNLIRSVIPPVLFLFLLLVSSASGQSEYYDEKEIQYTDRTYDEHIRTVLIHIKGSELDAPIIPLNGSEKIVLRFDDLSENIREMHYSFIHCTWDWRPSDLNLMDYQMGFNCDIIADYDFSFNTVTNYTNYQLEFPNDRISLTRSGNYIVKVYANGNPEELMLTARFMVVEPKVSINATVMPSSVVADRPYRQEVDVTVNLGSVKTMNPYDQIELVIMQNLRTDNMITGVKPNFIKNQTLTYNYQDELTFDGGNEYRFFDAKSLRYRSEEVEEVRLEDNRYHIYLAPDWPKAFKKYTFENDINGKLLVKNDDMIDPHLESDYVTIHFMFPVDAMLGNGDLYVTGQLANRDLNKAFRMNFNPDNLSYELAVTLKQGYYNYAYLWKYKKGDQGIWDLTDGNHSETENDYLILVYFKDRSFFSDRLVGIERINSLNN